MKKSLNFRLPRFISADRCFKSNRTNGFYLSLLDDIAWHLIVNVVNDIFDDYVMQHITFSRDCVVLKSSYIYVFMNATSKKLIKTLIQKNRCYWEIYQIINVCVLYESCKFIRTLSSRLDLLGNCPFDLIMHTF